MAIAASGNCIQHAAKTTLDAVDKEQLVESA
jgi:hypothetical protein